MEQNDDDNLIESGICKKDGKISFKTLNKSLPLKRIDLMQHEDLRNELKILYTAITRTRLRLIIFDEKTDKRKAFEKMIKPFDLLQDLNNENFETLVHIIKNRF